MAFNLLNSQGNKLESVSASGAALFSWHLPNGPD